MIVYALDDTESGEDMDLGIAENMDALLDIVAEKVGLLRDGLSDGNVRHWLAEYGYNLHYKEVDPL